MKKLLLVVITVILVISVDAKKKKNILFIMADDFNYWTSKSGYYPHAQTPNLDALAEKGVFFSDAHCSSPVCEPSRNALWSGLRPTTTCLDENGDGFIRQRPGLEKHVTMNQFFKENGYYVYGGGKLYHPGRMSKNNPKCDPENWTELNETRAGCRGGKLYQFRLKSKGNYARSANDTAMTENNCGDYKLANDVADFIKNYSNSEHKDQPFFIACGFFRPHMPWFSPIEFWNKFNIDSLNKPKGYNEKNDTPGNAIHREIVENGKWMQAIHGYLASCALADYNVGILLEALENSSYAKNTIVLFMGDHGWNLGEKGRWGKFDVCDEANHTSLIIYDPKAKGNGKECNFPVSLQDIYPTLVDICKMPENKKIEGNSLKPLLKKPNDKKWNHPVLMAHSGVNYIKTKEWRFVDSGQRSKLHHNGTDPYQWNNLYGNAEYDGVIAKLKKEMDSVINIGKNIRDTYYPETKGHYGPDCNPKRKNKNKKHEEEDNDDHAYYKIEKNLNFLTIDLTSSNPLVEIEIHNSEGKSIIKENIAGELIVDVELDKSLPKGKYFISITDESIREIKSFEI